MVINEAIDMISIELIETIMVLLGVGFLIVVFIFIPFLIGIKEVSENYDNACGQALGIFMIIGILFFIFIII